MTPADSRASRLFFHVGFIACLILQRFGADTGTSALFISLPIMMALQAWLLMTGRAAFRMSVVMLLMAFLTQVAISLAVALMFPDPRTAISFLSPVAVISNYLLFILKPTDRFDTSDGLKIFIFYARICVVAGIVQYLVQFVGIVIFSFMVTLPSLTPILVEKYFNFNPIVSYGSSILRSNGFFLVEPSSFSQIIVLAVCVDYFLFKRLKFMPLYGVAYLFSYSGTGLLSLFAALPLFVIFFYRQAARLLPLAAMGIVLVAGLAIALPDQFDSLSHRADELNAEGSSGHARYVGQFDAVDTVADDPRTIIGFGPGATERANFVEAGSGGPIQKLLIDYGVIGTVLFFVFFIATFWRTDMAIVPLLLFTTFLLGGGKLVSSPFLVMMCMICIWSTPPREGALPDGSSR